MTRGEATAEVFMTAFKALSKADRDRVLAKFVEEPRIREDLIDLAIVAQRQKEPSRPFREYLAERELK